jgi:hypothetical protein
MHGNRAQSNSLVGSQHSCSNSLCQPNDINILACIDSPMQQSHVTPHVNSS